jgi:hypothetical protein
MMIELKKEINALLVQLGEEPRYEIAGEVQGRKMKRITNYELRIRNAKRERKVAK